MELKKANKRKPNSVDIKLAKLNAASHASVSKTDSGDFKISFCSKEKKSALDYKTFALYTLRTKGFSGTSNRFFSACPV